MTEPHGGWPSPITADFVVAASVSIGEVRPDGASTWWSELRPQEGGRVQLVRDGDDVLPDGFSARTRVHEYGGGAWTVRDGVAFFANWADQRLYRLDPGSSAPIPLTPEPAIPMGDRFADLDVAPDGHTLVAVRERHGAGAETRNELVRIAADSPAEPEVVVTGPDFVSSPRHSPDGARLAWLQWDHPNMPWDGTELRVDGTPVAGGPTESVFQPEWSPDGVLHFVSDRTGWWNLYRQDDDEPVIAVEGEIGVPQWVFGMSRYAFLADGTVIAACRRAGRDELLGHAVPFTNIDSVRSDGSRVVFVGASFTQEPAVVQLDPVARKHELVSVPRDLGLGPGWISPGRSIEFPSAGGRSAHAIYYAPANPEVDPPEGERPPLLVLSHGGPTSSARPMLSLGTQFWTSRGFAVVDVDYGGSTGYGRAYRSLLDGQWGIVDVEDCVAAAQYLAGQGEVDPDRLCIRGGSAGGYTTLQALATTDVFAAGASHYGVADLGALARDTHKFEARYLDGLVGPWPEAEATYDERSPVRHTDGLSCPIIVLQGLEDEVVPPSQAEMMVDAVRAKGLPVAYVPFEGEQHGFRKAENIVAALEAELSFYAQVFGFDAGPGIDPVPVENLDR